ncbi:hypothetical protein [Agrobacterium vitis]|nr:hypothetical protein [Agrobacterium vitis]
MTSSDAKYYKYAMRTVSVETASLIEGTGNDVMHLLAGADDEDP